jgi:hypothetical protein
VPKNPELYTDFRSEVIYLKKYTGKTVRLKNLFFPGTPGILDKQFLG